MCDFVLIGTHIELPQYGDSIHICHLQQALCFLVWPLSARNAKHSSLNVCLLFSWGARERNEGSEGGRASNGVTRFQISCLVHTDGITSGLLSCVAPRWCKSQSLDMKSLRDSAFPSSPFPVWLNKGIHPHRSMTEDTFIKCTATIFITLNAVLFKENGWSVKNCFFWKTTYKMSLLSDRLHWNGCLEKSHLSLWQLVYTRIYILRLSGNYGSLGRDYFLKRCHWNCLEWL